MRHFYSYDQQQDFDGRPKVYDHNGIDQLLEALLEKHGERYAHQLLLQDAALSAADESDIKKLCGNY